jgi:O-antigen/teichoic acid export membrane protein
MAYADLRFADALGVDTASSVLLFAWLVIALTSLDAGTALIATGVSGLLPSVILLILHRNKFHFDRDQIRTDRQVSWRFGRWVALSQMTHTAQGYVVHWILAAVGGTTATGIYSACWSIVQLASPFVQGVGNAAGPLISRAFAEGGIQRTQSAVRRTTRLLALSLASHAIVMLAIGDFLQRWLYGQQYAVPSLLPGVLAMAMGAASVSVGWSKGVSVMEKPYWNTWLNLMGLILTCTSVTVFTVLGGVAGAAWAFLFSSIIISAARWSCYSRLIANHRSEADFSSSSAPVAEVA